MKRSKKKPGWKKINFRGWINRYQIVQVLGNARGGLLVLHPRETYLHSYPIKLFEYMAAGLPVIASDFPLWRRIVNEARCGLLVDPQNPSAIADAMDWILDHPEEAEGMGKRGKIAVEKIYNWQHEANELLACYRSLMRSYA